MELTKINVEEECWKRIKEEEKKIFLPYVFNHKLFPRVLYFPVGSFAVERDLVSLFRDVCALHTLPNEVGPALKKIGELSLAGDLLIRNQEEIFEDTGEMIMVERLSPSHSKARKVLSRFYPEKEPYYQLFCPVEISKKPYSVLIQAGFSKEKKLSVTDNLPNMEGAILEEEKPLIYPLFDDILGKLLFLLHYAHLN